jgi:hypothetical protein
MSIAVRDADVNRRRRSPTTTVRLLDDEGTWVWGVRSEMSSRVAWTHASVLDDELAYVRVREKYAVLVLGHQVKA